MTRGAISDTSAQNPTTFAVAAMSPSDPQLYTQFAALKGLGGGGVLQH